MPSTEVHGCSVDPQKTEWCLSSLTLDGLFSRDYWWCPITKMCIQYVLSGSFRFPLFANEQWRPIRKMPNTQKAATSNTNSSLIRVTVIPHSTVTVKSSITSPSFRDLLLWYPHACGRSKSDQKDTSEKPTPSKSQRHRLLCLYFLTFLSHQHCRKSIRSTIPLCRPLSLIHQ